METSALESQNVEQAFTSILGGTSSTPLINWAWFDSHFLRNTEIFRIVSAKQFENTNDQDVRMTETKTLSVSAEPAAQKQSCCS